MVDGMMLKGVRRRGVSSSVDISVCSLFIMGMSVLKSG